jgi:hypothetical protein
MKSYAILDFATKKNTGVKTTETSYFVAGVSA